MRYRCAVLDDYHNIALASADWSAVTGDVDITVFNQPFASAEEAKRALAGFHIICAMTRAHAVSPVT